LVVSMYSQRSKDLLMVILYATKAKLVAKGHMQQEGIDYNEIFSTVVQHSSVHILLALVA